MKEASKPDDDDDAELRNLPTNERCDTEDGFLSTRSGKSTGRNVDKKAPDSSRKLITGSEQKQQQAHPLSVIVEEEKYMESSERSNAMLSQKKSSQEPSGANESTPDKDAPELQVNEPRKMDSEQGFEPR